MTALALARLPVAAGGAVLETTGNIIHWGFARFMRAPLANSGMLAMVTFTAMAGSNALYWQDHAHPAPLFSPTGPAARVEANDIVPVVPAVRPKPALTVLEPLPAQETTGSVEAAPEAEPIGNAEVTEIQRKLRAMQIFDGEIDGLYGPRTARAIRAFEERMGMHPRGELTRDVLEAVRAAPLALPEAEAQPLPEPEPLPSVAPAAEPPALEARAEPVPSATREVTVEPLPAPEPLAALIDPTPAAETTPKQQVLHRDLPETPQEAMDIAVETAGEAIETIIAGVQSIAMTTPGTKQQPGQGQPFAATDRTATASVAEIPAPPTAKASPDYEVASLVEPRVGATLVLPDEQATVEPDVAVLDTEARPEDLMPAFSVTDPVIVAKVQRGLASLGFLHGPADGVAGEATAKAIRNFEVYFNYKVTGRVSPELLDLLVQNGASF